MEKVLLIQTAFIGDVILASSLVEKLRSYYPELIIDFLLRKGNESLLEGNPNINKVIVWDKTNNKYSNLLRIIAKVRKSNYDIVVNLQRFTSTGIITALSGSKQKFGFDKNPLSIFYTKKYEHQIKKGIHEIDRNQQLISSITDSKALKPKLYPKKEDYEKISDLSKSYITISPGSVWFTKQFPSTKWIELINETSKEYTIYLLGGINDKYFCEKIITESENNNCNNLAGELSLLQSAALMEKAKMNYVNDSAPLHLCSAVNAPVTAVFCSTVPEFGFGPLSKHAKIVETSEKLPCRPCGLHGSKECKEGHFNCAYNININDLILN